MDVFKFRTIPTSSVIGHAIIGFIRFQLNNFQVGKVMQDKFYIKVPNNFTKCMYCFEIWCNFLCEWVISCYCTSNVERLVFYSNPWVFGFHLTVWVTDWFENSFQMTEANDNENSITDRVLDTIKTTGFKKWKNFDTFVPMIYL